MSDRLWSMEDVVVLIDRREAMRAWDTQGRMNAVLQIRSAPSTSQRYPEQKIVAGLLLVAAVIFLASVIGGIFR